MNPTKEKEKCKKESNKRETSNEKQIILLLCFKPAVTKKNIYALLSPHCSSNSASTTTTHLVVSLNAQGVGDVIFQVT
jgi:hypothetical protein